VFPRSSDVGRRWDRLHTRVRNVRCAWAPTAMSHCAGCLRPTLPEARNGSCLSIERDAPTMHDRGPGSMHQVAGVRWASGEIPSTHASRRVEKR
jgi:hypothetical protein